MNSFEYLQIYLDQLSENKLFIGLIMVLVNIGARFIIEEFSEDHIKIIKNPYFRKLIVFSSVFMATRDIIISLIVTLIFAIVINEILNNKESNDKELNDKELNDKELNGKELNNKELNDKELNNKKLNDK